MKKAQYVDPLFIIFEKSLYDFHNEDLDLFISTIVTEYLDYLNKHEVIVPEQRKQQMIRDLADEVYDMYVKKVHGCLNFKAFRNSGRVTKIEKLLAKERYFKLTGTE